MATVQQTYSCPSNPGDRVSTTTHQWKLDTSSGAPLIVSRTVVNTPPRSESGSGDAPPSLDEINRNSPLQPVFFANGSAVLSAEAKRVLDQNAAVLRTYSTWTITIEGHCDELGSAEENLAMGERRAIAARTYLIMVGIAPERLRTVSYGKEFPFDPGNTEQARAENRRAHFVITAK